MAEKRKSKKVDQITTQSIIVVASVVFFVIMLVALIVNVVKLTSLNSRKNRLEENIARAERMIDENDNQISYRQSREYIDKYAREFLDMQGKDEITFIGKK